MQKKLEKSVIEKAFSEVLENGQSINKTAFALNISKALLTKIRNKRIFTTDQKSMLADYF